MVLNNPLMAQELLQGFVKQMFNKLSPFKDPLCVTNVLALLLKPGVSGQTAGKISYQEYGFD